MAETSTVLNGVIHGKIIELDHEPGLPDGQPVTVRLEPAGHSPGISEDAREALRRAAGSWSDDPEGLERYLEWNRQQRKVNRREMLE
jgi:hypothetical protein